MPVQRLTAAYRSRPRPSSTPGAKASTVCPYYLDGDQTGRANAAGTGDTRFNLANICGFQAPVRSAARRGFRRVGLSKLNSVRHAGPARERNRRARPGSVDMLGGRRALRPGLIDGVRAAQRLSGTGLSASAKVAFRGYSQGGGAAMWAGQLLPEYAPELDLVGVVGGGGVVDLSAVALRLNGKPGFGFLAYALLGAQHAYPDANLDA